MTPPAAAPVSCLEFFVTLASLILSVYDFSSDFIVAIETSGSVKSQTLYGDVIIYEKSIGKSWDGVTQERLVGFDPLNLFGIVKKWDGT